MGALDYVLPFDLIHLILTYDETRKKQLPLEITISKTTQALLGVVLMAWAMMSIVFLIAGIVFIFASCCSFWCVGGISTTHVSEHITKDVTCCHFQAGINTSAGCAFWFDTFPVENNSYAAANSLWASYPLNSSLEYDGRMGCPLSLPRDSDRRLAIVSMILLGCAIGGCLLCCCFFQTCDSSQSAYKFGCCGHIWGSALVFDSREALSLVDVDNHT
jgi:hypothetical protein